MNRPDKLAPGQVWRSPATGCYYIVHRSPTGKNFRALGLSSFIAREWTTDWELKNYDFICVLDGKALLE